MLVQVAKYFGLEDSDLPAIAVHDAKNDGKYFLKNAKPGAINKWLDDFEVCSHKPAILSSPIA